MIVGALVPYIKFVKKNSLDFCILELDKSALKVNELKYIAARRGCGYDQSGR